MLQHLGLPDPREDHEELWQITVTSDTVLEFHLAFTDRQHSLGRLRLSVTSAPPPIEVPKSAVQFVVCGTLPATESGGILAVSDCFSMGSNRHWSLNCKAGFTVTATVDGRSVEMAATIDNGMYAAPWQTWSVAVTPAAVPRSFELTVSCSLPASVEHHVAVHFLPGS